MYTPSTYFNDSAYCHTPYLVSLIIPHGSSLNVTYLNKLKCCEFKGKQASRIESTSLCCRNYSVLHVRDQKNEWSVFVE